MKMPKLYLNSLAIVLAGGLMGCSSTGKPPSVVSATPASGTATPQTFTVTGRDTDGNADIALVYFLINTTPTTPANTCHGYYQRADNAFYLFDDATKTVSGPLMAGGSGTLENSQCIISGNQSSLVSASGTDLTVNFSLGLKPGYSATQQNVYFYVKDKENHDTGWIKTGTWF